MSSLATGCGSVWLERSVRDAEAARSNRAIPTIKKQTGSSEAGARFFMLQAACGPCRVLPVPVRGEGGPPLSPKGASFLNCRNRWDQVAGQCVFQGLTSISTG